MLYKRLLFMYLFLIGMSQTFISSSNVDLTKFGSRTHLVPPEDEQSLVAFAQSSESDNVETKNSDEPLTSITLPDLYLVVQGKLETFPGGQTEDALEIRKFLQRIKSHIAVYIHEIDADYKKFLEQTSKIQNNSIQFKQKYKENITKYLHDKNKVLNLNKEVQVLMQKTSQASKDLENINSQSSIGFFRSYDQEKQKALLEIQENVDTLAKYFKQIQAVAQKLSDEVATFADAMQADAALLKVSIDKKAEQAANEAAEKAADKAEEEPSKQAENDAHQTEMQAKAAKDTLKKQQEIARKLQMNYRKKKADQLDQHTKIMLEKVAAVQESVQNEIGAIKNLISQVLDNQSNYITPFVGDLRKVIVVVFSDITEKFEDVIDIANQVSKKLSQLDHESRDLKSSLSSILGRGGDKIIEDEIMHRLKDLELEVITNLRLATRTFNQAELYQKELRTLHDTLQAAEKDARKIDPKNAERIVGLIRATNVKQNEFAINILQLIRAVKMSK